MPLHPNGQPPGVCAPHGGHDALKSSHHATTSYRGSILIANPLHGILKEEHKQKKKQESKQQTRRKGLKEKLPILRDEHKQAYQLICKVWLALQPTLEWEAHQQLLRKHKPPRKHQSTREKTLLQAQAQRTESPLVKQDTSAQDCKKFGWSKCENFSILSETENLCRMLQKVELLVRERVKQRSPRKVPFWRWGGILFTPLSPVRASDCWRPRTIHGAT